jgi:4-amino-4-deoxy-L-arabinose transferase-like glycosyltransferase
MSVPGRPSAGLRGAYVSAAETVAAAPRRRLSTLGAVRRRDVLIAVSVLAVLVRLPLLWDRYDPSIQVDPIGYLHLADRLLAGLHFPSDFRGPGYPLFLTLGHALPGRAEDMDVLLQHILGVGLAAATVVLGWRYFGPLAGTIAGVVAAVTPVLIDTEHNLMPDFVFALGLLGASVLLLEIARQPFSYRRLVVAGVAFGLLTYLKPNGQAFIVAALVPLAFATRDWRRTLAGSAVFAAALVVTLLPWMARNAIEYGHFSFSSQGGQVLFLRVFDEDGLPIPTDTPNGQLANRIHADALTSAKPGQDPSAIYLTVLAELEKRGLSESEASAVMQDLATTAIKRDPARYVAGTVKNMGLMVARSFYPRFALEQLKLKLQPEEFPRALAIPVWLGGSAVEMLFGLVTLGGLAVFALRFTGSRDARLAAVTFGWIWLILAGSVSVSNWPNHRLATQALPLLLLLGAAGVVAAAQLVQSRRGPERIADRPA